jgi:membrane associated rhomboid family serine protease
MLIHALVDGTERALLLSDFEDLVRSGRIDAETPVRVGDAAPVPARTLSVFRDVVDTPAAHFRTAWDRVQAPWATALLCGLCVRSFLWVGGESEWTAAMRDAMTRSSSDIVLRGEVSRLLSYAFVHSGVGHILSNLAFLLYIGVSLERVAGPWAIFGLWAVSSASGGLLGMWFAPDRPSVGASGVDYGFLAAAAVIGWRWLDLIPAAARTRFGGAMLLFTLYSFWGGVQSAGVDSWAHLGGLLAGGVFAAFVKPVANVRSNLRLTLVSVALVAVALVGVRGVGWRMLPVEVASADGVVAVRPSWWSAGWTEAGGSGWAERTGSGAPIAALGLTTERRGRDWASGVAVGDVLALYREADPWLVVASSDVVLDAVPGTALDLEWVKSTRSGAQVRMVSHVEIYVRGHYRHVYSWDARRDLPDAAGFLARLRGELHLRDTDALAEHPADATSLRGRTLRARALYELGRRSEALGLFPGGSGEGASGAAELVAALSLCTPEWDLACAPMQQRAESRLDSTATDVPLRVALVRAQLASGDGTAARATVNAGLARNPADPALIRLKEALPVPTGSGVLPE